MLRIVMLNVVMLGGVMLSVFVQCGVMISAVMLNVMAPNFHPKIPLKKTMLTVRNLKRPVL
jgi:hypothetical protein